jgi:alpha-tubulin suppressor-like RCC1 family protein
VAVGSNDSGQCDVADWSEIVAVAAGSTHTLGLRGDGTVVAAGSNEHGQCDITDWDAIRTPD